ncbi:MAG: chemotaxis protein CheA [Tissierellaceae bacterium]|nr:chemotaxis protein CheA [Tissierellaceae bacterium]
MDDNNKYIEIFFQETDEYLQRLNECLLELERNPDDISILDEIFRAAHTLKGMAATMGYNNMAELTHHMESVFELFRSGKTSVNSEIISLIFKCLDRLSEIVEDLREGNVKEYNLNDLISELDKVSNYEPETINTNQPSDDNISDIDLMIIHNAYENNYKAYRIKVELSNDCILKGARAYVIINKLEKDGEIIQSDPNTEVLESGEFDNIFKLIYITKLEKEQVLGLVEDNLEIDSVYVQELNESLENEFTFVNDNSNIQVNKDTEVKNNHNNSHNNQGNQYIRVDLNKIDSFMNLVSELVIYRTRLENVSKEYKTTAINEPLEHVARITTELQDLVLKIRMQPVNVVFNRFPRMIRDLSQELNKDFELIIEGEDTELDRTVVSELSEPLVHLIRNAADHGIESPERRVSIGKSKTGLIKLSAYQEGNRVIITIQDDGKGIDPKAIKESAIRKGLKVDGLTDKELVQLIFNQGFSTSKEVTNISGRGVGMDVVRQKIESLGGEIDVVSQVDKGTTFIIKLPLTLSIIQALLVKVGQEVFALPLGVIERVVKVEHDEIVETHGNEVYVYKNKAIPVIRLSEKLSTYSIGEDMHMIIVLLGDQYYGLIVDELIGQQEIVIKKLGSVLSTMKEYLGATILGNGDITLILDLSNICSEGIDDEI